VVYGLLKLVLTPLLRLAFRVEASGLENVPAKGAVIVASNHQAFCDSLFIPLVLSRRVTFVAKSDYFESWRTAWFFRAVGQIPMDRSGGAGSRRSLGEAARVLSKGGCIGIYPEGTRSPDEHLHKGRTGAARLAIEAGCPVVPVGIRGTRVIQPIGARVLRPFKRVEIAFGRPIDLASRYGSRREEPLALREATDEVMLEIAQLSGQPYVDCYASRQDQEGCSLSGKTTAHLEGPKPEPMVDVGSGG
jgi:1-acyl-sn-glycerol-3-phosphate acyltransferase